MDKITISILYFVAFLCESIAAVSGYFLASRIRIAQAPRMIVYGIMTLAGARFYEILMYLALGITRSGFCLADLGVFGLYLFFSACFVELKDEEALAGNPLKPVTAGNCLLAAVPALFILGNVAYEFTTEWPTGLKIAAAVISTPAVYVAFNAALCALRSTRGTRRLLHGVGLALTLTTQLALVLVLKYGHTSFTYILYAIDGLHCIFVVRSMKRSLVKHV